MQFCPKLQSAAWGPVNWKKHHTPLSWQGPMPQLREKWKCQPLFKKCWVSRSWEQRIKWSSAPCTPTQATIHHSSTPRGPRPMPAGPRSAIRESLSFYGPERPWLLASVWLGVARPLEPRSHTPTPPAAPHQPPGPHTARAAPRGNGSPSVSRLFQMILPPSPRLFSCPKLHSIRACCPSALQLAAGLGPWTTLMLVFGFAFRTSGRNPPSAPEGVSSEGRPH